MQRGQLGSSSAFSCYPKSQLWFVTMFQSDSTSWSITWPFFPILGPIASFSSTSAWTPCVLRFFEHCCCYYNNLVSYRTLIALWCSPALWPAWRPGHLLSQALLAAQPKVRSGRAFGSTTSKCLTLSHWLCLDVVRKCTRGWCSDSRSFRSCRPWAEACSHWTGK